MATQNKPLYDDRIVVDPRIMVGKPVIRETRIPVSVILNLLANGANRAEIQEDYPDLTDEDIRAAIAYAAELVDQEAVSRPRSQ